MAGRRGVRSFFTNWSQYEAPLPAKLALLFRNRGIATLKGCCGHPGEPGC